MSVHSAVRFFLLYVFVLFSNWSFAAIPSSEIVGYTKGSFSVSPSGSATYDIPIKLPPNVGGVQPNLSLSYDSSAGNGLLGIGWHLTGLSSITRCPANKALDGYIDPVDFDGNDQYCLDGQRLVHLGGSEYRTEMDDFSYIETYGSGFKVTTASGIEMTYGTNTSSMATANVDGSIEVVNWLLRDVSDQFGNYYRVNYKSYGGTHFEIHPDYIDMFNATGARLGTVSFEYQDRESDIQGFIGGAEYKITQRLKKVKVQTLSYILVRTYELGYVDQTYNGIREVPEDLVNSVVECDAGGLCLESVNFTFVNEQKPAFNAATSKMKKSNANNQRLYSYMGRHESYVDLDGDGLADKVWVPYGQDDLYVAISNGDGFDNATSWMKKSNANNQRLYSNEGRHEAYVDLDGNGLADKVWVPHSSDDLYVALLFEDGFQDATPWMKKINANNQRLYSYMGRHESYVDLNADGLPDKVWVPYGQDDLYVAISTGNGFEDATSWMKKSDANNQRLYSNEGRHEAYVDLNGDGLADKVWVPHSSDDLYVALSTGNGFETATPWMRKSNANNQRLYSYMGRHESYVDLNGDGLVDKVWVPYGHDDLYVAISKGNGFKDAVAWMKKSDAENQRLYSNEGRHESYVDVDGNGLVDKVWVPNSSDSLYVALSTGTGFTQARPWLEKSDANNQRLYSNIGRHEAYVDINGDGFPDKVWVPHSSDDLYVSYTNFRSNKVKRVVSSAQDIQVLYKPLLDESVYDKVSVEGSYPVIPLQTASYVVSQVSQLDGAGGQNIVNYKYEGLRHDIENKRSLGFAKSIIENTKTGLRTETNYNQNYPYIGMPTSSLTELVSSGQDLVKTTYSGFNKRATYSNKTYFLYFTSIEQTKYLLNDNLSQVGWKKTNTSNTYDASGQLTQSVVSVSGSDGLGTHTTTTQNTFSNQYSDRRQGEIVNATVTSTSPTASSITRESSFEYDWSNGKLVKETIEPNSADNSIKRITEYSYDSYGNRVSSVTCDGSTGGCSKTSPGARYSDIEYDANGVFPVKSVNALGHETITTYDSRFGKPLTVADANGLTKSFIYDSFGRLSKSTDAFGNTSTISRAWCDWACPTVGAHQAYQKITTTNSASANNVVYLDQLSREIRKQTQGFDGSWINVDTEYDSRGRVKRTSEPYYASSAPDIYWNTPSYDALDRKRFVTTPKQDGSYDYGSQVSYNGFSTIVTDALGRSTTELKNVIGKVTRMTDKAGNSTDYEYDAFGNLLKTTDSAGNVVELFYDQRGRKTQMIDPDMGTWTYKYNTFDQLIEQTDAKLQKTVMDYDVLGRMTSRTDKAGTNQAETSTWVFDTAMGKSLGKLHQKINPYGHSTSYSYNDTFGQLISTTQNTVFKSFTHTKAYDAQGRLSTISYPQTEAYPAGFKVAREYNQYGYLYRVNNAVTSESLWQATYLSPRGQVEAALFGNGVEDLSAHSDANGWLIGQQTFSPNTNFRETIYTFDAVGNIESRWNVLDNDLREHFSYDALDRLTSSYMTGGDSTLSYPTRSYQYDALGNIAYKSDVGSYSYLGCGGRPHAVCSAGSRDYVYDVNGAMIQVKVNGSMEKVIHYESFGKPRVIQQGTTYLNFSYGADRNRIYRSKMVGMSIVEQIYYVGAGKSGNKLFEQVVTGGTTKSIHYVYGMGGRAIATHVAEGSNKSTEYLHRDHLGSIALRTNDAGTAIVEPVSFDAFGKRRNANWTDATQTLHSITGNIGFTGQESVEDVRLVHMNGRMYDPELGRFISADPIIQAPYNSQSYNRYSYVMNNPLGYIDPTGYSWVKKKWKKAKKNWTKIRDGIKGAFLSTMLPGISPAGGFKAGYSYRKARNNGASSSDALKSGVIQGVLHDGAYAMAAFTGGESVTAATFAAVFVSNTALDTGVGRSATRSVANEFFGDFLGIGDRGVNMFLARLTLSAGIEDLAEPYANAYLFKGVDNLSGVKEVGWGFIKTGGERADVYLSAENAAVTFEFFFRGEGVAHPSPSHIDVQGIELAQSLITTAAEIQGVANLARFGLPAVKAPTSVWRLLKSFVRRHVKDVIDQPATFGEMLADEFGMGAINGSASLHRRVYDLWISGQGI